MASIRTGASAILKYGYESSYAVDSPTCDKKFGLNDSVTSWSLTTNRIDLASLNQVEYADYAYGQQQGSLSVGFTMSNPWIFRSVFGAPTVSTNTFTYGTASGGEYRAAKDLAGNTVAVQIGVDGSDVDVVRTCQGGVVNSLGLSTSIGNTVQGSIDMTYGKEVASSQTLVAAPTKPTNEFPYTFAHGELIIKGDGTAGNGVIQQLQDVDITFAQNSNLLYQVGQNAAKDAYRQIFDVTGRFRAAHLGKDFHDHMIAQLAGGSYSETVGGTVEFKLSFVQTAGTKEIVIKGTGLSPTDYSISGIVPVEPIFEDITWRIKSCQVVAEDASTTEE